MNQDHLINNIGKQMELLSSLGIALGQPLAALSDACAKALLNGGKLILVTDAESTHAQALLSYLLKHGERLERPQLPVVCIGGDSAMPTTMLDHIYQPHDLVIAIARHTKAIDMSALQIDSNHYVISADAAATHSNAITLPCSNRSQWCVAITLLCNLLIQQIEYQLFGLQTDE